MSGFLQGTIFLFTLFFVNKVVLSEACLYELCWIEHESMLLAYHGNIFPPKEVPASPLCPSNKRRLNAGTEFKFKRFYQLTLHQTFCHHCSLYVNIAALNLWSPKLPFSQFLCKLLCRTFVKLVNLKVNSTNSPVLCISSQLHLNTLLLKTVQYRILFISVL